MQHEDNGQPWCAQEGADLELWQEREMNICSEPLQGADTQWGDAPEPQEVQTEPNAAALAAEGQAPGEPEQAEPEQALEVGTMVLAFDFETVPHLGLYREMLANGPDKERAMAAAATADKAVVQAALGPRAKMGRISKADAMMKFVEEFCEDYEESCSKMGMDPMRLMICTAAVHVVTPQGPQTFLLSWGTGEQSGEYTDPVTGTQTTLYRSGLGSGLVALDEMTEQEALLHERVLLLGFWHIVSQFAPWISSGQCIFATHNGANFDVPALRWRTVAHRDPMTMADGTVLPGVRPAVKWSLIEPMRFRTRPHLDTCALASNWNTQQMAGKNLEAVARAVGVAGAKHDGMSGQEVFPAACRGEWERINTYCVGDACMLHAIAQAFLDGGV